MIKHTNWPGIWDSQSALSEWAEEWQLAVSVDKCCALNTGVENCPPHLVLNNCVLPFVPHTHDLDVIVSYNLSPAIHVAKLSERLIGGPKSSCEPSHLVMLSYLSVFLLRMCGPYWSNTVIWSSCGLVGLQAEILMLSSVSSGDSSKCMRGYAHFSCSERLSRLKLQSLKYRRLIARSPICCDATKLSLMSSTFLQTSCSILVHVPTHVGMRTNCIKVNHWPAFKTFSAKGSSVFGMLYLPMIDWLIDIGLCMSGSQTAQHQCQPFSTHFQQVRKAHVALLKLRYINLIFVKHWAEIKIGSVPEKGCWCSCCQRFAALMETCLSQSKTVH